ncbi:hypothetical protein BDB01DRAFT_799126 [Pilobolus umbonatus]|nr:hypothetical protein BDB01DRAFT_799126 [Pilobolus umbonatus]
MTSIDAWILMSLVYRDLDDKDYTNALLLSERLYAIDKTNPDYKYSYGLCLFYSLDYTAAYSVLDHPPNVQCAYLFAKSCYELGKRERDERKRTVWEDGVDALKAGFMSLQDTDTLQWGQEFKSITLRQPLPSVASMYALLGDLYVSLENIQAAAIYYLKCLRLNPYKLSVHMKLCDIAHDASLDIVRIQEVYEGFKSQPLDMSCTDTQEPPPPSPEIIDFSLNTVVVPEGDLMPPLTPFTDISVKQLRSVVFRSTMIKDERESEIERGGIEVFKDEVLHSSEEDISIMKRKEAYSNKHGLHQKPSDQIPQKMTIELYQDSEEELTEAIPPRVGTKREKKGKQRSSKRHKPDETSTFHSEKSASPSFPSEEDYHDIRVSMARILHILQVIGSGYMYQTLYECRKSVLELQKLDNRQYDTPTVLCIIGKDYYDTGDHLSAYAFYRHAFFIAPWYCDGVPLYSTCLWYLGKEKELNVLAFKMRHNVSHQFEAYVAGGNWGKLSQDPQATKYFEKAVEVDPSKAYGHYLVGYEEWEKGHYLRAKEHYVTCMRVGKRSYLGWFGMATAHLRMEEYQQAKTLLDIAIEMNPIHPVMLATMAEVLYHLGEYESAYEFITKSLVMRQEDSHKRLKVKIEECLQKAQSQ